MLEKILRCAVCLKCNKRLLNFGEVMEHLKKHIDQIEFEKIREFLPRWVIKLHEIIEEVES